MFHTPYNFLLEARQYRVPFPLSQGVGIVATEIHKIRKDYNWWKTNVNLSSTSCTIRFNLKSLKTFCWLRGLTRTFVFETEEIKYW